MESKKNKNRIFTLILQNLKMQIITCVVLSLIVIVLFYIANVWICKMKGYRYSITNEIELINQIEDVDIEDNKISIKGYSFLLGMDSDDTEISILLRSIFNGKEIWADVSQSLRADVASFFNDDYNYEKSGFIADVKKSRLKVGDCYEIIVKLDYEINEANSNEKSIKSKTVSTNKYIMNEELYSYNPVEYNHPNIELDSFNEVFYNGQLSFYKDGMYVYQFNNKLYWFTNDEFYLNEDGLTYIPCNVYTSHVDKLPENRKQSGFETLGFIFEEHEYTDQSIYPYHVAIWDIPNDYPISHIITGNYDHKSNTWIWSQTFKINYIFR